MKVENLQQVRAGMLRQSHEAKLPPHKPLMGRPHAEIPWPPNGGHHRTQLRAKLGVHAQNRAQTSEMAENLQLRLDAIVADRHPSRLLSRQVGFSR
jgi:hypothetical protein